jgi:hypothetical protein
MILEGVADFYLYVSTKTKRWDICPGDAMIKCFGVINLYYIFFRDNYMICTDKSIHMIEMICLKLRILIVMIKV